MTPEQANESLHKAKTSPSVLNYSAIYQGFAGKGIAVDDIIPRVNVFTYAAWFAQGRQVKKGEHGVKVLTYIKTEKKLPDGTTKKELLPRTTTVFHLSQTEPKRGV